MHYVMFKEEIDAILERIRANISLKDLRRMQKIIGQFVIPYGSDEFTGVKKHYNKPKSGIDGGLPEQYVFGYNEGLKELTEILIRDLKED